MIHVQVSWDDTFSGGEVCKDLEKTGNGSQKCEM